MPQPCPASPNTGGKQHHQLHWTTTTLKKVKRGSPSCACPIIPQLEGVKLYTCNLKWQSLRPGEQSIASSLVLILSHLQLQRANVKLTLTRRDYGPMIRL
eukprot:scaffold281666_cov15-Tisochrysis_lutea.AAC.1